MQPKRTLVVAHREELIFQAVRRIEEQAGLDCGIEMAEESASMSVLFRPQVVVATIQTLISGSRLERFKPNDFGALVIDEAHHGTAGSYRRVIDHFRRNPDLRIVGCTATPDRADEEALGQIFESVADVYEILDAIHDGWLCPIDQQMVSVGGLDFSSVRTTAGDLNQSDLAKVMESEKNLHGVVGAAIDIIGDRQTLVFTSSVRHAEMACEIFNRHRSGIAGWISGRTDKEERRQVMKNYHAGKLQVLCNVGCLTEGVDVPGAEVVIMARPTKSRALYAQMAGRILRPLPGLCDACHDADERKWAISASKKPSALIIDFVGNSGRHRLMTAADILGGKVSEQAVALAIAKATHSGRPERINELLDETEQEILAQEQKKKEEERLRLEQGRRARVVAKVNYAKRYINPFDMFDLQPARERGWDSGKSLSEKQRLLLLKQGVDGDAMPYAQAKQVLNELFRRWKGNLASLKQIAVLNRYGYEAKDYTRDQASALLDKLANNGWRKVSSDQLL